ncbi:type I restriction enzyme endonuclease domain-containing protein, partial [Lactiplantibacillus plantarum]|uniref:type I restriction enzyme endonuclease domain-containing protein n=1 Tax=Lactiplantibacillus plantarum TaxID=1590 RepID=UPI003C21765D
KALMELAKETIYNERENENLGLSQEELAFYHAISDPENIQNFYNEEELVELTKKLTQTVSEEMTPDWMMRESGKANVRRAVKRLLKKHQYPAKEMNVVL